MPQTQLKTEILIRCYLYSARLPRTRTGRVRHSKFDCTENKDVLFRERIIKEPRLWGGGSKPPVLRPCFLGFLILALFRLRNIKHRWVIAPYFLRFPPFQKFHLLPFSLPLPIPLLPQLSGAPFLFRAAQNKKGGAGGKGWGGAEENEFFSPDPRAPNRACLQAIKRNRHQISPCNISALQNKVGT